MYPRRVTRREYLNLRAKIEQTYRDDLAALDRVWRLSSGRDEDSGDESEQAETPERRTRGSVDRLVRWVIADLPEPFGLREVQGSLSVRSPEESRSIPRASISSALMRLADAGMLDVVEQG